MDNVPFSVRFKRFLISGSASLYGGFCPIIFKHIHLADKSDLRNNHVTSRNLKRSDILGFNNIKCVGYTSPEWEITVYLACQLLEKRGDELNINTLIEYSKNVDMCRESIIFFLAAWTLIKSDPTNNVRQEAYLAIPLICKTTREFFLFVQLRKLLSVTSSGMASGKGFKKSVLRWYQSFKPEDLILELIRTPGAFKWRHKDLLKLCHISKEKLSIGHRVVFQYIFTDARTTIAEFETIDEAKEIIDVLMKLSFTDSYPTIEQYLTRARFIKEMFDSSSYLDFPYHCYNSKEMWHFVVENVPHSDLLTAIRLTNLTKIQVEDSSLQEKVLSKLSTFPTKTEDLLKLIFAINRCHRTISEYKRRYIDGREDPPIVYEVDERRMADELDVDEEVENESTEEEMENYSDEDEIANVALEPMYNLIATLDTLIMTGIIMGVKKLTDQKTNIYIHSKEMHRFIKIVNAEYFHNEITGVQAATYIAYQLFNNANDNCLRIFQVDLEGRPKEIEIRITSFRDLLGNLKYACHTAHIKMETAIEHCNNNGVSTCIMIFHRLFQEDIIAAFAKGKLNPNLRIILLGVAFNSQLRHKSAKQLPINVLIINEFSVGTYHLIEAFVNKEF